MDKTNVVIECRYCHSNFNWSSHEQQFYEEHNFQPPKSCYRCKVRRKKQNVPRPQYNKPQPQPANDLPVDPIVQPINIEKSNDPNQQA